MGVHVIDSCSHGSSSPRVLTKENLILPTLRSGPKERKKRAVLTVNEKFSIIESVRSGRQGQGFDVCVCGCGLVG